MATTTIHSTTRLLLAPALAVGLVFSGLAVPHTEMTAATAGKPTCCPVEAQAGCCGTTCCQAPVPGPKQPQSDQPLPSNQRPPDGKATWIEVSLRSTDNGQAERFQFSPSVPASGSPSLITQHVRLQT